MQKGMKKAVILQNILPLFRMPMNNISKIDFTPELLFVSSRSSGKGGQNVNKLSTKVELQFDFKNSNLLTDEQKALIELKLGTFINKVGILKITSQEDRSQLRNKENCIRKFYILLERALRKRKKRIKTKPSKASKEKRLKEKRLNSEKKRERKIH
jgi:ribosome-associated protein